MSKNIHTDRILILDFGSQYTQLIARRVRELGVYCELHPYDVTPEFIQNFAPKGIILSGGPASALAKDSPRAADIVFELGCPVLGICYGMQTIALQLGGSLEQMGNGTGEFGYASVELVADTQLLANIHKAGAESQNMKVSNDEGNTPTSYKSSPGANFVALQRAPKGQTPRMVFAKPQKIGVWMSHGDHITAVPPGFVIAGYSGHETIAIMADESRHFYGVQFHPEVTHTPQGKQILSQFVHTICGCAALWQPAAIVDDLVEKIRQQVGQEEVILGLSGGVDSSVVAALLHQAIGEQLKCVFVDTGLLRLNEREQVVQVFQEHFGIHLIAADAKEQFLQALAGITDPEEKRRIIGQEFITVFENEAKKLPGVKWLAQGTIYPDVIESADAKTGKAQVIKTHHNVGGLPARMHLKVLEPLRELFKDEVRSIGKELGLPHSILGRHPFPGPGLGVRILGEVKADYVEKVKQADAIFIEELYEHGLYDQISQAFAVFLPVYSVGVTGDGRRYEPIIALRAVVTTDFMTAQWAHLPYELLTKVSLRIVNEVPGISRVVYDISGKPPATIEWE